MLAADEPPAYSGELLIMVALLNRSVLLGVGAVAMIVAAEHTPVINSETGNSSRNVFTSLVSSELKV